jgi:uncharacterized membrane protein (DUF373 family)
MRFSEAPSLSRWLAVVGGYTEYNASDDWLHHFSLAELVSMAEQQDRPMHPARKAIVQAASLVEDIVYVGLGALLAISALSLLWSGLTSAVAALVARSVTAEIPSLLDQILLILLVIELLYTVQVSFREHGLLAEPFLVVALIAVIRRILVVTAELPKLPQAGEDVFRHAIVELGILTVMVVALVGSFVVLRKSAKQV